MISNMKKKEESPEEFASRLDESELRPNPKAASSTILSRIREKRMKATVKEKTPSKKKASEMERDSKIAREMLRYAPCPEIKKSARAKNLDSWGLSRTVGNFLLRDPNALLLGAIFDFQIPFQKAWEAPCELQKRLGHLDPYRLAKMSKNQLLPYIRRGKYGNALHRFPSTLTRRTISASQRLIDQYSGNASNIWINGAPAKDVITRLEEFDGISQKISRMMGRLLGTYFGVHLTGWNEIDIPVDRHVARVFLRTGLVKRKKGTYSVAEVRDEIIQRARELKPSFPGCLDEPAFDVGIIWCNEESAYCNWPEEACPLRTSCRKKKDMHIK